MSNLLKVVFDALQGAVYADDYQVQEFDVRRGPPDPESPECVVLVGEIVEAVA